MPATSTAQTHFHASTPQRVRDVLESARLRGDRVRLFYGDTDSGVAWGEENDVAGRVGRSTGTEKIPLLCANARSTGGGGILDHCIVAVLVRGRYAYRHPSFNPGTWTVRTPADSEGYAAAVDRADGPGVDGGKAWAQFRTVAAAHRWAAFMRGERMGK